MAYRNTNSWIPCRPTIITCTLPISQGHFRCVKFTARSLNAILMAQFKHCRSYSETDGNLGAEGTVVGNFVSDTLGALFKIRLETPFT